MQNLIPLIGAVKQQRKVLTLSCIGLAVFSLSACELVPEARISQVAEPTLQQQTETLTELQMLPAPTRPVHVAVYRFDDQTGQNKPNEDFAVQSRALSQGGATIMVNALQQAGKGTWFTVLEREQLGALLEERKLIRASRAQFAGQSGEELPPIPPLLNAGILLAGGVIGYDTNLSSGGYGARFLGVGGDEQYRQDNVSVYLRAVSVTNGKILASVVSNKTIYSTSIRAGVFRYIATDRILELEAGVSTNEPKHLALKQAMESAVYSLILKGAQQDFWSFKDPAQAKIVIENFKAEHRTVPVSPASLSAPVSKAAG